MYYFIMLYICSLNLAVVVFEYRQHLVSLIEIKYSVHDSEKPQGAFKCMS